MIIPYNTCWVFDLDDTLYKECTYQRSGFRAVIDLVQRLYNIDVTEVIEASRIHGLDVFEQVCLYLSLPLSTKDSLLWCYRLHQPNIELSENTKSTLQLISKNSRHSAIITDGRVVSQKLKVKALGLSHIPTLVSEEWGENKPNRKRFDHVMQIMSAENYVYVGDNLKKDFVTPNKLGWITIGIKDNGQNIHSQDISIDNQYQPTIWLEHFSEIKNHLC